MKDSEENQGADKEDGGNKEDGGRYFMIGQGVMVLNRKRADVD